MKSSKFKSILFSSLAVAILIAGCSYSQKKNNSEHLVAIIHKLTNDGTADIIGKVKFKQTENGLKGTVQLDNMSPGEHGFHIHAGTSCGPNGPDGQVGRGLAALGHYDPDNTHKHLGPLGDGHKGDLPKLIADKDGKVNTSFVIPDISISGIQGRAIVIHDHGDNYSDTPKELGGGGGRYACGILE